MPVQLSEELAEHVQGLSKATREKERAQSDRKLVRRSGKRIRRRQFWQRPGTLAQSNEKARQIHERSARGERRSNVEQALKWIARGE